MSDKKYFTSNDARLLINTYGFSIFPTHGIYNDVCTCGDINCTNPGKHPATSDGFKSATNDINKLLSLWASRKYLNVGVATGAASNIFVIDIDSAEGEKNLRSLGKLPDTLSVSTGKGRHLYFKYPDEAVITKRGILPEVDVRGDGGYVCGPGSNHASGSVYSWINPLEEIQKAPDFILDLVVKSRIRTDRSFPRHLNISNNFVSGLNIGNKWSIEDIADHLSYISPNIGFDDWIKVGMGLKDAGVDFSVFDNWSSPGNTYNQKDALYHWNKFDNGKGVTYGTVVHMAQQGGWKPKSTVSGTAVPMLSNALSVNFDAETGEILGSPQRQAAARILPLIYADDINPITDTSDFIENLLCENQFSVIYGESNCGKTFFMMDLAMHVALGKTWRGRQVDQGGVIYAALEGGYNTQNRIVAFRKHHNITENIPLAVIPSSLNLLDPEGDINSLVESIWTAKERIGNIKMVIIDTLSRALHGGDENSSMDMGQLIINADAIRSITGAHISFVHHCGKDAVKGARGHSSLRAAVDTEIEISRDDDKSPSRIKIVKQREMEMGDEMFFTLSSIELGKNQRDKPVTSCVVLPAEQLEEKKQIRLTSMQRFVMDAITDAIISYGQDRNINGPIVKCISYEELRQTLESRGYKKMLENKERSTADQIRAATTSVRIALKDKGLINFGNSYIWII